jgi:hypothetical protein
VGAGRRQPVPAFIVGSGVICDPGDEDKVTRGVVPEERGGTGTVLHGSDTFGLDDMDPRPFDDPEYLASVKDDLTRLFQVFVTAPTVHRHRDDVAGVGCGAAVRHSGTQPTLGLSRRHRELR